MTQSRDNGDRRGESTRPTRSSSAPKLVTTTKFECPSCGHKANSQTALTLHEQEHGKAKSDG